MLRWHSKQILLLVNSDKETPQQQDVDKLGLVVLMLMKGSICELSVLWDGVWLQLLL